MSNIVTTRRKLTAAYNEGVEKGHDKIVYEGAVLDIGYLKYLLEYVGNVRKMGLDDEFQLAPPEEKEGGDDVDYAAFVLGLCKPPANISSSLSNDKVHMMHMALGIAGEAGELVDVIKKHIIYERDLDRDALIKEGGDLFFYFTGLFSMMGISLNEIVHANYEKLSARYKTGFSNEAANNRVAEEPQHG